MGFREGHLGHGGWGLGLLLLVLLIGLAGLVAYLLVRAWRSAPSQPAPPAAWPVAPSWPPTGGLDPALAQARLRYARGELSRDEYARMVADLGGAPLDPHTPPPAPAPGQPTQT